LEWTALCAAGTGTLLLLLSFILDWQTLTIYVEEEFVGAFSVSLSISFSDLIHNRALGISVDAPSAIAAEIRESMEPFGAEVSAAPYAILYLLLSLGLLGLTVAAIFETRRRFAYRVSAFVAAGLTLLFLVLLTMEAHDVVTTLEQAGEGEFSSTQNMNTGTGAGLIMAFLAVIAFAAAAAFAHRPQYAVAPPGVPTGSYPYPAAGYEYAPPTTPVSGAGPVPPGATPNPDPRLIQGYPPSPPTGYAPPPGTPM